MILYFPFLLFANVTLFFSFFTLGRWAGVFTLALLTFAFNFYNSVKLKFYSQDKFWIYLSSCILLLVSYLNFNLLGSVPGIVSWFGLVPLLFILFVITIHQKGDRFQSIITNNLLTVIVIAIPFFFWMAHNHNLEVSRIPDLALGNSKHFSQICSISFAYLLASISDKNNNIKKAVIFFALLFLITTIFLCHAFTSLMACIFVLILAALYHWKKVSPVKPTISILILSIVFFVGYYFYLLIFAKGFSYIEGEKLFKYLPSSMDHRMQIFASTLGMIKSNWLSGVGPGLFLVKFPAFQNPFNRSYLWPENNLTDSSHNFLLDMMAETGIPFFILIIFVSWRVIFKKIIENENNLSSNQLLFFALPFAAWIIEAQMLFPHQLPLSFTFGMMILAQGFLLAQKIQSRDCITRGRQWELLIPITIIMTIGGSYLYVDYRLKKNIANVEELSKDCDRAPIHWRLCGHVADLYLREGQPSKASQRYIELLHSFPFHFPFLVGLAHAYAGMGNPIQSCRTFTIYETLLRYPTKDYRELRNQVCSVNQ